MKCIILKDKKIALTEVKKPDLKNKKGAIVKIIGCGLCGSDIVKINNAKKENEGNITLGHEIVGEITEINCEIKGNGATEPFKKGDIIAMGHHFPCFNCKYCAHGNYSMCEVFKKTNIFPAGFSEYIFASEGHLKNTVFKKPENLSFEEISFLEPLACCNRAIKRSGINKVENFKALVLGLGSIGILMAQGLKAYGVEVYGFDINNERQKFSEKYGVKFNPNIKYDLIFMTAGSACAIKTALDLIDFGGKIIVFSSISDIEGYPNDEIYYKELSIIGSYSPAPADLAQSYELLAQNKVNVQGLSSYYSLDNLQKAINDTKQGKILKAFITI